MLFSVLFKKAYSVNLQYRAAHLSRTIASLIFGYVYISIWIGIGSDHSLGEYGTQGMIAYIAASQSILWVTLFVTYGLGIEQSVRTGNIALDLMRPVHPFYHLMWKEWGRIGYQFVYRTIPIYLFFLIVFSISLPEKPVTWLFTAIAVAAASYLNICINYCIGILALWTGESRWLYWLHYSIAMLISGFFIPIEWLPKLLQTISAWTPYPYIQYTPVTILLETNPEPAAALLKACLWCGAFTSVCFIVTFLMRRKLEVQGG